MTARSPRMHFHLVAALMTGLITLVGPARAQVINEEFKMQADDGEPSDQFGISVALNGDHAVIGAAGDDVGFADTGSAYVLDVNTGEQLFKLVASDGEKEDHFGNSVAISGNIAVIGAAEDDVNGGNSGSVYLYDVATGQYISKLLALDGAPGDQFGSAVAARNGLAIIAAQYRDGPFHNDVGSAFIFDLNTRQQLFEFFAQDGEADDQFGKSVAISEDHAIIGAWGDDDNGDVAGSAYIFSLLTGQQMYKLLPSDVSVGDQFGHAVAIDGDYAIVGANGDDEGGSSAGAVYVFDVRNGQQLFKLTASDAASLDLFGSSVALSGNYALIGALRNSDNGTGSGSAYFFDVTTGEELCKLIPSDGATGEQFGNAVAIISDQAVIGAFLDDDNGQASGSAYVFQAPSLACVDLFVDNLVAGEQAVFTIMRGTPGAKAVTVYGTQAGQTNVNNVAGYCAAFEIKGVKQSKVVGGLNRTFDANGKITFNVNIPGHVSGVNVLFQSAERDTCPDECVSNLVDEVIG